MRRQGDQEEGEGGGVGEGEAREEEEEANEAGEGGETDETCLSCLAPETKCFFGEQGGAVGDLGEGPCKACKHLKGQCKSQCPGATTSASCAKIIETANNDADAGGGDGTNEPQGGTRTFPSRFVICQVEDSVDGGIGLSEVGRGTCADETWGSWMYVRNPPIEFSSIHGESTQVYNNDAIQLKPVWTTDAVALGAPLDNCVGRTQAGKAFIGQRNGNDDTDNSNVTYYQHDRRMRLQGNTADSPASFDAEKKGSAAGSGADRDAVCPVVPRTFLNENSCVRQESSICGKKHFAPDTSHVTLNKETLSTWYSANQRHVYVIRGLRLEKYYDDDEEQLSETWFPPCFPGYITRWIKIAASGGCTAPSPWNAATSTTIASALSSSSSNSTSTSTSTSTLNAVVRDVLVRELEFVLLKEAVECEKSEGELYFGVFKTVAECAAACRSDGGCRYFLFGVNARVGRCYMEDVANDTCGDLGFQDDKNYDFYKLEDGDTDACNMEPKDDLVGATVEVAVPKVDDGGSNPDVVVECWQHVHPEEMNVYDFSRWTGLHPGNDAELKLYRRNPITQAAEDGTFELWYPSHHPMSRWNSRYNPPSIQSNIIYVGLLEGSVDFASLPAPLQTVSLMEEVGATYTYDGLFNRSGFNNTTALDGHGTAFGTCRCKMGHSCTFDGYHAKWCYIERAGDCSDGTISSGGPWSKKACIARGATVEGHVGFEACGSRGEVANDPEVGNRFYSLNYNYNLYGSTGIDQTQETAEAGKTMTWTTVVFNAHDQLRQRAAWALSQIFTVGTPSFGYYYETELWVNFYDIFVANAFGNFADIVREVAASPLMGEYLTYRGNSAVAYNGGKFPDENFVRFLILR